MSFEKRLELEAERARRNLFEKSEIKDSYSPYDPSGWERLEIPVDNRMVIANPFFKKAESVTVAMELPDCPQDKNIQIMKGAGKLKMNLKIRLMLYNSKKNVTTVVFEDGDVRMAKRDKKDKHDPYLAVAMCVASKVCKSKTAFKKLVDKTLKQI